MLLRAITVVDYRHLKSAWPIDNLANDVLYFCNILSCGIGEQEIYILEITLFSWTTDTGESALVPVTNR